jgi:hypothetical protein
MPDWLITPPKKRLRRSAVATAGPVSSAEAFQPVSTYDPSPGQDSFRISTSDPSASHPERFGYPVRFGEGLCNQVAQDLFHLAYLRFLFAMLAESWGKSRRVRDPKGHNTVKPNSVRVTEIPGHLNRASA